MDTTEKSGASPPFRLSLLNNFYCEILHLYNTIVIPTYVQ